MKSQYLITGASGYIGSRAAAKLIASGEDVTVVVRQPSRLNQEIRLNARVITADLRNREVLRSVKAQYDYIIHCAAPTGSACMITNPVEVTDSIVNGTKHILDIARQCGAKSVVNLSSMEVYGQVDCAGGKRTTEEQQGYIDVTRIRSCYPLAKRMAENLCCSYFKEYGIPVKTARLAQTFGQGADPEDTRIFAQFARAVKNGTDLVLHTAGNSMGNYCDINDTVEAVLFLLQHGENGQIYNVVNEANTMTIREMAELVADKIAEGKIKVTYDISEERQQRYAADTGLRMSGEKLRALGWEASAGLEEMYRDMLRR